MSPDLRATLLAGSLALLLAAPAAAGEQDDPRLVLLRMTMAARNTVYEGRKVVIDLSHRVPAITRYEVVRHHADRERKEFPELGRILVRKDGWLTSYDPKEALVVRRRFIPSEESEVLQRENLDLILRNYRVSLAEGAIILGRPSVRVTFDPVERGSRPTRRMWVDREKGLPLRGEVYGTDGTIYLVSHFEQLRFDPELAVGTFDIRAPGVRVVDSEGGFGPHAGNGKPGAPRKLPAGFVLAGIRRAGSSGPGRETQTLYTDGLSSLSFFQGVGERRQPPGRAGQRQLAVGRANARVDDYGLLRMIRWNEDGRHYVLVGELPLEEMALVARSVEMRGGGK